MSKQEYKQGELTDMSATEQKKKKPRYREVADKLTEGILTGKYPLHSILPGENEVAALYGLSRHTAREAMRILEQNGLITRRRRAGSMVVNNELPTRYNQKVQSVNDLLQYGNASRLHIIQSQEHIMSEDIAALLHSDAGKACLKVDGIRYQRHDNRPFAFTEIYFKIPTKATRTRLHDLGRAIKYVTSKLDIPNLGQVEQTLTAEVADASLAKILEINPGAATLKSLRTYVDTENKLIAVAYSWHAGDLFSYSTVLTKV